MCANRISTAVLAAYAIFGEQWNIWAQQTLCHVLEAVECALESEGMINVNGEEQLFELKIVEMRLYDGHINAYFGCDRLESPLGYDLHFEPGPTLAAPIMEGSNLKKNVARIRWIDNHCKFAEAMLGLYDVFAIAIR